MLKLSILLLIYYVVTHSTLSLSANKSQQSANYFDITSCIPDWIKDVKEVKNLECKTAIQSLKGIEQLTELKSLTLWKSSFSNKEFFLSVPENVTSNVEILTLKGVDWQKKGLWNKEDLKRLMQVFPLVNHFICVKCGVFDLGFLSGFPLLKKITLNMLPVVSLKWVHGEAPLDEITFDGLEYENIDSISISSSPMTNVSCKNLGVWWKKVSMYYSGRSNWPIPYKSFDSCFPEISILTSLIVSGDKLYKEGDINSAHNYYMRAFEINPYNSKAISSLSLSYYKLGEYCKSAQVAASGAKLITRHKNVQASIFYNYYLSLLEMNDVVGSKTALMRSMELSPSEYKEQLLKSLDISNSDINDCALDDNWISNFYNNIERLAVQRSRSDKADNISYSNFLYSSYKVISAVNGKVTDDMLYVDFNQVEFSPGIYGVILNKEKNIDRSPKRRQDDLICRSFNGSNILRELSVIINDHSSPEKEIELIKVFKVDKPIKSESCYLGGDGWVMDSDNYTVEIVKFKMDK